VPDSQLIDSASVQTIASRIRQPPAQKPSTLTGGRMADALGHTDARYTLLVAASTLFILVGGIPLAYTVTPAITLGRGLGGFIFTAPTRLGGANSLESVLTGVIAVVILALILDGLLLLVGRLTTSRGIHV